MAEKMLEFGSSALAKSNCDFYFGWDPETSGSFKHRKASVSIGSSHKVLWLNRRTRFLNLVYVDSISSVALFSFIFHSNFSPLNQL
jgi:hypothetical protein